MSNPNGDVPNVCAFCGIPGHWKSECLVLDQYIKDGKVAKDANNFLAPASGTRLPVGLQGRSLKERFDEYYRQNPTTTTAPSTTTLMYSLSPSPPESPYAPRSMLTNTTAPDMSDLSLEERNILKYSHYVMARNMKAPTVPHARENSLVVHLHHQPPHRGHHRQVHLLTSLCQLLRQFLPRQRLCQYQPKFRLPLRSPITLRLSTPLPGFVKLLIYLLTSATSQCRHRLNLRKLRNQHITLVRPFRTTKS